MVFEVSGEPACFRCGGWLLKTEARDTSSCAWFASDFARDRWALETARALLAWTWRQPDCPPGSATPASLGFA
jgi:hypothetical protein